MSPPRYFDCIVRLTRNLKHLIQVAPNLKSPDVSGASGEPSGDGDGNQGAQCDTAGNQVDVGKQLLHTFLYIYIYICGEITYCRV